MIIKLKHSLFLILLLAFCACKKSEFLDKKPKTNLVVPETLDDMSQLLSNTVVMVFNSPTLPFLSADEYYYPSFSDFNSQDISKTERNAFIWAKDIYAGEVKIPDWNLPYQSIFYCNVVLDQWDKLSEGLKNSSQGKYVKGWALFSRAFCFYNLVQTFSPAYDPATAGSDLGIPLKLSSNINDNQKRASVQETYNQILKDLSAAEELLAGTPLQAKYRNQPSSVAVNALLSRIYLSMGNYPKAAEYAARSLELYNKLIDFNSLSQATDVPFDFPNDELLWFTGTSGDYYITSAISGIADPHVIDLYEQNDLRKFIFFRRENGQYFMNLIYHNYNQGGYPFTGLAVDEQYLIAAESLARDGNLPEALNRLNALLIKRYVTGTYVPFISNDKSEVLAKILLERRKELVWRGLRWSDLKRLNKEGANITLTRNLGGQTYTLPPNDPRYVMPIPDDEIALSGIQQNSR
ncbi:RagB/SusD family nutrient uptake outer membrane protein [Pedobacter nutrimenti]|uniref:SusD-like starch-binding protein associating with outer membrane n=1 Tax=Pedobacter nutrimenti TaxID=1241337 RepID=A0A318UJH9_9SPHI|nr:RagB/SusD family nutrient uptake outer membrane protein [Pedobacter nutrimenti]PYF74105.1 SusD-like starch-binding protein associating with outer membrane [Pedobacter nutrimenti]